ncbi:hypothetical protein WG66_011417 [Moniliophthora roreri]|nr:hypothetical protein WG66_011417 [Moniliophthora roreri]
MSPDFARFSALVVLPDTPYSDSNTLYDIALILSNGWDSSLAAVVMGWVMLLVSEEAGRKQESEGLDLIDEYAAEAIFAELQGV